MLKLSGVEGPLTDWGPNHTREERTKSEGKVSRTQCGKMDNRSKGRGRLSLIPSVNNFASFLS